LLCYSQPPQKLSTLEYARRGVPAEAFILERDVSMHTLKWTVSVGVEFIKIKWLVGVPAEAFILEREVSMARTTVPTCECA